MKPLRALSSLTAAFVFVCSSAQAQGVSGKTLQSLSIVQGFAESLCGSETANVTGSSTGAELSIGAEAKIAAAFKKLAEIGVSASSKYTSTSYRGVLHGDLAKDLASRRDCRFRVFDRLTSEIGISYAPTVEFTTERTLYYSILLADLNKNCRSEAPEINGLALCIRNLRQEFGQNRTVAAISLFPPGENRVEVDVANGMEVALRSYSCQKIRLRNAQIVITDNSSSTEEKSTKLRLFKPNLQPIEGDVFDCLRTGRGASRSCRVTLSLEATCRLPS